MTAYEDILKTHLFVQFKELSTKDIEPPKKKLKHATLAEKLQKVVVELNSRTTEEFAKGIVCNLEF